MSDHEPFLLLAARQLGEPLPELERTELEAHLAGCASCRSMAAGMRHDDARLRAAMSGAPVSPRVRRRVLDEAAGRRHVDVRLVLALAAILLLGVIGAPLMLGGRPPAEPAPSTPTATPAAVVTASPATVTPSAEPPVVNPSAPASGPFVAGAYVYGDAPPRRDTVSAHFENGPVGEWSRRTPATGDGTAYSGPVTCLVIDGSEAWLAGPVETASDGSTGAAMLYLHDGGPEGQDDEVVLWLATSAQTLTTMTGWCENRFIPAGPFPVASGDVVVEDGLP